MCEWGGRINHGISCKAVPYLRHVIRRNDSARREKHWVVVDAVLHFELRASVNTADAHGNGRRRTEVKYLRTVACVLGMRGGTTDDVKRGDAPTHRPRCSTPNAVMTRYVP